MIKKVMPRPLSEKVVSALFNDPVLSLDEANVLEIDDARRVNAVSGGNKVSSQSRP